MDLLNNVDSQIALSICDATLFSTMDSMHMAPGLPLRRLLHLSHASPCREGLILQVGSHIVLGDLIQSASSVAG